MFCQKCGSTQADNAAFCSVCGAKLDNAMPSQNMQQAQYYYQDQPAPAPAPVYGGSSKGIQIAGFVTGLISLVLFWIGIIPGLWPLGILIFACGIVGTSLSGSGIKKSTLTGERKGLGIAGLVCGIIGMCLALIYTIIGSVATAATCGAFY